MRSFVAVAALLALAPSLAWADMSMPTTTATPKWVARCASRLEQARDAAEARLPIFHAARIEGAELWLDETILGGQAPAIFDVLVVPRRSLWSDPSVTTSRWQPVSGPGLSIYRQSPTLEGSIVAYQLDRWGPNRALKRVVDELFKPAVDDCLSYASIE